MSQIRHTPEAWKLRLPTEIVDGTSDKDFERHIASFRSEHDALRTVQCVNAMKGIENPEAFMEVVRHLELDAFQTIQSERNELLECLQDIIQRFQSCIHGGNGELADDKPAIEKAKAAINISIKQRAIGK